MHIIYFLVPVGIVLMLLAAWGFYYAVKTKQFDDLTGDAERIVLDDRQLMRNIHVNNQKHLNAPTKKPQENV